MVKREFLSESDFFGAPELPHDRPPTRREVWEYYSFIFRNHRSTEEIKDYCRNYWVEKYTYWFGIYNWRKQPDWVPGQPVIPEAVPTTLFPDEPRSRIIYECLERARRRAA